jgi:ribosome maturation factor RimP
MESMIERIRELTLSIVREEGLELFHLEFKRSRYKWFLRVYLDREGGINLNDCEIVSKRLSTKLDEEDFIPYRYILEVSSPGLDRPLLSEQDYTKYKGKHVRIKTSEAIDGQRNFKGRLANYVDGIITLEMQIKKNEVKSVLIPYHSVAKARLEIEL